MSTENLEDDNDTLQAHALNALQATLNRTVYSFEDKKHVKVSDLTADELKKAVLQSNRYRKTARDKFDDAFLGDAQDPAAADFNTLGRDWIAQTAYHLGEHKGLLKGVAASVSGLLLIGFLANMSDTIEIRFKDPGFKNPDEKVIETRADTTNVVVPTP